MMTQLVRACGGNPHSGRRERTAVSALPNVPEIWKGCVSQLPRPRAGCRADTKFRTLQGPFLLPLPRHRADPKSVADSRTKCSDIAPSALEKLAPRPVAAF